MGNLSSTYLLGIYYVFQDLDRVGCEPVYCVEHRGREDNNTEQRKVKICDRELPHKIEIEESKVKSAST